MNETLKFLLDQLTKYPGIKDAVLNASNAEALANILKEHNIQIDATQIAPAFAFLKEKLDKMQS